MKTILIIFPHQLFAEHPGFAKSPDKIILIEDSLFFGDQHYPVNFHKQKLLLHRASMKYYESICSKVTECIYIDYDEKNQQFNNVIKKLSPAKYILCDPVDFILSKRIKSLIDNSKSTMDVIATPGFLNSKAENLNYRSNKKRWYMADFYQQQRLRLNILIENGNPVGGKWSYDSENRKKLPKKMLSSLPTTPPINNNKFVKQAELYIQKFKHNSGSSDEFIYPTTHDEAKAWLSDFLKHKFQQFGPYEDAIVPDENWLYHSVLTPALNIGLLTPKQVIDATLHYAKNNDVPLSSLEGFIRQIIGWREFMRATYEDLGVRMRNENHWQHTRKIPNSFYNGTTGIEPIDNTIKRLNHYAYCHHIERLMVLGGFMFICEFDPDDIYRWFMELFIDSYDWVMVPNVYAMSQHADGGLITTKPYFSGSSYIKKMSHYQSGPWCETWDGLYWRFIFKHAEKLKRNPRWSMMVAMANKMDETKKHQHLENAESFLKNLK